MEGPTSPRVRVGNFDIAGVTWGNFEPGIDVDRVTAIWIVGIATHEHAATNTVATRMVDVNVANMSAGVDITVVTLGAGSGLEASTAQGWRGRLELLGVVVIGGAHHMFAGG
jgi:hypothetical protein